MNFSGSEVDASVHTVEPQYSRCFEAKPVTLGPMTGSTWRWNPKRLTFVLARYKWVAHMLKGMDQVAEIGCGDAFASKLVGQEVKRLHLYDFDPLFVEVARKEHEVVNQWNILDGPLWKVRSGDRYDAVYMVDALEHIRPEDEPAVMRNICDSLVANGVFIAGVPSLEAQPYSSELSKMGHVNCRSGEDLKHDMQRYFNNVFLFSVNDEMVHTGFTKLAHYLFALCVAPKMPTVGTWRGIDRPHFGVATTDKPAVLQDKAELDQFISLMNAYEVKSYLEIGARYGGTFETVMSTLPSKSRGVAVDLPGGPFGDKDSETKLIAACNRLRLNDRDVLCFLGNSQDIFIARSVADNGPYDAILIDGDHSYEGVMWDWERYRNMAPMVAFHDIAAPPGWTSSDGYPVEVPRLWNEIKRNHRHTEIVTPGSKMGIGVVWP